MLAGIYCMESNDKSVLDSEETEIKSQTAGGTDRSCAAQGQVAQLLGERSHHGRGLDRHSVIHGGGENCTL